MQNINKLFVLIVAFVAVVLLPKLAIAQRHLQGPLVCADKLGEICISNAYNDFSLRHRDKEQWVQARLICEAQYEDRVLAWRKYYEKNPAAKALGTGPEQATPANRNGCMRTLSRMSGQSRLERAMKARDDFLARRAQAEKDRLANAPTEPTFEDQVAQNRAAEEAAVRERRAHLFDLKPLGPNDVEQPESPLFRRARTSPEEASEAETELASLNAADMPEPEAEEPETVPANIRTEKSAPVVAEPPQLVAKTTNDSLPPELQLLSADEKEARVFVRKGAYFQQIEASWLAKNYHTEADVVYPVNQFKDTFGVCVSKDGKRVLDESRMKVKSWEEDKLNAPPDLSFMKSCKGTFTLGLQGYQVLVLPHRGVAAGHAVSKPPPAAAKNVPAKIDGDEAEEPTRPTHAKKAVDAGVIPLKPCPKLYYPRSPEQEERLKAFKVEFADFREEDIDKGFRNWVRPPQFNMMSTLFTTELTPEVCAEDSGFCYQARKARRQFLKDSTMGGLICRSTDAPERVPIPQ